MTTMTAILRGPGLIDAIETADSRPGTCTAWWLGQHGFVLKFGRGILYVDPFLSPVEGRLTPPLLEPGQITHADIILGSHDHVDHIDRAAWPAVAAASPGAIFVVPELLRTRLAGELGIAGNRLAGVDEGLTVEHDGVRITGIPAAHEFLDTDPATGLHPYLGFVIECDGVTVYHAGDTCIYEGLVTSLRRWSFDAVFLPINGRDARRLAANCIGNMTYQEAADLAGALAPGLTVPAHFDMFAGNRADPGEFLDYMRVKYPHLKTLRPRYADPIRIR